MMMMMMMMTIIPPSSSFYSLGLREEWRNIRKELDNILPFLFFLSPAESSRPPPRPVRAASATPNQLPPIHTILLPPTKTNPTPDFVVDGPFISYTGIFCGSRGIPKRN
jgi:hypothetical protein